MTLGPLPVYPWDQLEPFAERARQHDGGMINLSIGSPVDATPQVIRDALARVGESHAYPTTVGTEEARAAVAEWYARRRGVPGLTADNVMLTVGSKEFIAWVAFFLGLGEGDVVVQPSVAYPTYEIGAVFAGAELIAEDDPAKWPENTRLVWLNSPGNPDGRVLDTVALKAGVDRARELGAVVIGDECYAELAWDDWAGKLVPSVLDPAVTGGNLDGLLACYSLSKQSNLAGYRAAFVAGDAALLERLLRGRKHAGLIVPGPIQSILPVALGDDAHVGEQRERYARRREILKPALEDWGLRLEHSVGGLYLWGTRDDLGEDERGTCWRILDRLADLGILAGPGAFYGEAGRPFVRVALTATDEQIAEAAARLRADAAG